MEPGLDGEMVVHIPVGIRGPAPCSCTGCETLESCFSAAAQAGGWCLGKGAFADPEHVGVMAQGSPPCAGRQDAYENDVTLLIRSHSRVHILKSHITPPHPRQTLSFCNRILNLLFAATLHCMNKYSHKHVPRVIFHSLSFLTPSESVCVPLPYPRVVFPLSVGISRCGKRHSGSRAQDPVFKITMPK